MAELVLSGRRLCAVLAHPDPGSAVQTTAFTLDLLTGVISTAPSMEWSVGAAHVCACPVVWPEVNSDVSEPRLGMVSRPS